MFGLKENISTTFMKLQKIDNFGSTKNLHKFPTKILCQFG